MANEWERLQRQRYDEAKRRSSLFDAAMDALEGKDGWWERLGTEAAANATQDGYDRSTIKRYEEEQAQKAAAKEREAARINAARTYDGPPMKCEVEVGRGTRWVTYGRCDKNARYVVNAQDWKDHSKTLTLRVCTVHRNQAAKDRPLTKHKER